ncbi:DHH family phosphoesterase [Paucilactobacillus wasatchensis]|uniref:Cyclic-di-AMP phosphodiesterase n=1 Tax=Paucilactobacillus wasatchensis TaxID=1335616 RepID=A0A0D1A6R4_9LACO|nr:DHH family phosphoesterase [Paucilactobacillus wasatchensis]KIS03407.1 Phosphoesterase, DHH family protein [Paucilactobacillus wasatchensis]
MSRFFDRENLPFFLRNSSIRWVSIFMFVVSALGIAFSFLTSWVLGIIMLVLVAVALYFVLNLLRRIVSDTNEYISDLSYRIESGEQEALIQMPVGMIVFDEQQEIEWINPYMVTYFADEVVGKKISEVDTKLAKLIADNREEEKPVTVEWQDHRFSLLVQADFNVVYLMDVTHYAKIDERYQNEKVILGNIYLDNYAEITQGMSDSEVSNLHNYVTSELDAWAQKYGLFMKVIDDDYLILGHQITLQNIEKDKFSILDVIRENTSKQNSPVTLSVGVAYGDADLNSLADLAQSNLDLALGRGGDQVVVKADGQQARFYGGKTNPMEKRTRVRARMISQALQELMNESDQIFVQGHRIPDMDSLGACMGIRRIAKMNGQECWIVLDQNHLHSDIERLLTEIEGYQDIKDHIITAQQAEEMATTKSLLVMVDHSKASISMSAQLYDKLQNRVMIIDHHRRGEEFPENPILVYIEPYASSTCELITEMFEYQPREGEPINKIEATAMLTGIQVDTKSFTLRAGTRTFDAASYLRSAGADGILIQKFMKENVDSYLERNHLITTVDFIDDKMALCAGEDDHVYDSVTAAQTADSLLQMAGVDASFVITLRDDLTVGISARSIGDFNVQVIMEQLGGGGHLSNAATQIKDQTVTEVKEQLVAILKNDTTKETKQNKTRSDYQ